MSPKDTSSFGLALALYAGLPLIDYEASVLFIRVRYLLLGASVNPKGIVT
jgi:hypothetical protein